MGLKDIMCEDCGCYNMGIYWKWVFVQYTGQRYMDGSEWRRKCLDCIRIDKNKKRRKYRKAKKARLLNWKKTK